MTVPALSQLVGWLLRKLSIVVIVAMLILMPIAHAQRTMFVKASSDKTQYSPGETVTITGIVLDNQSNPVLGAGVSIQANDPQGNTAHVQLAFSDQAGGFQDSFLLSPNALRGEYQVYVAASKAGYDNAQASFQFSVLSPSVSTTSTIPPQTTTILLTSSTTTTAGSQTSIASNSKCFIATATYGSELSPEVTLLRNFRDLDVVRTSSGRSFMVVFNAFYYSFSPRVAAVIASNNLLRMMMAGILYPLVGILYLTSGVFIDFAFNPELAVTISGIFASLLIGAVYIGPIVALVDRLGRRRGSNSTWMLQLASSLCALSLGLLALTESLRATRGLELASVATVLSFLMLGGLGVSWLLTHVRVRASQSP